jgi:hypothetical protein
VTHPRISSSLEIKEDRRDPLADDRRRRNAPGASTSRTSASQRAGPAGDVPVAAPCSQMPQNLQLTLGRAEPTAERIDRILAVALIHGHTQPRPPDQRGRLLAEPHGTELVRYLHRCLHPLRVELVAPTRGEVHGRPRHGRAGEPSGITDRLLRVPRLAPRCAVIRVSVPRHPCLLDERLCRTCPMPASGDGDPSQHITGTLHGPVAVADSATICPAGSGAGPTATLRSLGPYSTIGLTNRSKPAYSTRWLITDARNRHGCRHRLAGGGASLQPMVPCLRPCPSSRTRERRRHDCRHP